MGLRSRQRRPFLGDVRPYLSEATQVRVRFQEVDSMSIVWHGHYLTYFEDARRAFGRRYGLDYSVFLEHNIGAPMVSVWVDFLSPARPTTCWMLRRACTSRTAPNSNSATR